MTVIAPMVAVADRVLVSVTCCEALLPTRREPKLTVVAEALITGAVPAPEAVITVGEFVALLATEMVAARLPLVCGANVIVAVTLEPAAMVVPFAMPLTE